MLLKSGLQVLTESFATLTAPRVKRTRWHKLVDIVMIAVCGAICECNSWEDLPRYGRAKKDWLKGFLELSNGIPSADTFACVFQRLKVDEFLEYLSSIVSVLRRESLSKSWRSTSRRGKFQAMARPGGIRSISCALRLRRTVGFWVSRRVPRSPTKSPPYRSS